jgi:hypothetical protein
MYPKKDRSIEEARYKETQRRHAHVNEGVLVTMTELGMKNSMFRHINEDDVGVVVEHPKGRYTSCYTVMFARAGLTKFITRREFKFASPAQSKANKQYTENKRQAYLSWVGDNKAW